MACKKVAYRSKEAAHHSQRAIEKHGKRMRCYVCEWCHQYHLTSDLKTDKSWFHKEGRKNRK